MRAAAGTCLGVFVGFSAVSFGQAGTIGDWDPASRTRVYWESPADRPVPLTLDLGSILSTRWSVGLPEGAARIQEKLIGSAEGLTLETTILPGPADSGFEGQARVATRTIRTEGTPTATFLGQPAIPEEFSGLDGIGSSAVMTYSDERGPVRVASRTLARGWIETPAGPFIASLRREEVFRSNEAGGPALEEVRFRWVSARIGTVAVARVVKGAKRSSGAGSIPEVGRDLVDSIRVLALPPPESVADMRIYHQELFLPDYGRYFVGWDKGSSTSVDSLTPETTTTFGSLLALNYWDFSGNTTGTPIVTTQVPLGSSQTCNMAQCGFSNAAKAESMTRDDRFPSGGSVDRTNSLYWDDGDDGPGGTPLDPAKITSWLLAGAQHEGVSDFFSANGEGRFCFDPDAGRTRVPATVYGHQDGRGYYVTSGDTWQSAVFTCDQNTYDTTCGTDDNFLEDGLLHSGACQAGGDTYPGRFENQIVKAGTVKLPSGHTFNTLVFQTRATFCSYFTASSCNQHGSGVNQTNQYVTLFSAPYLDAVVRLDSPTKVTGVQDGFTTLTQTQIGLGLFPPVSIQVTAAPSGQVQLSWNPGGGTAYIDRYKVYWGTASGVYPFNSDLNPGSVSIVGTTATISGLADGTTHYVSVTSLDGFATPPPAGQPANPSHEYESLLFPTVVTGDPDFSYPAEVAAVPGAGCVPTTEVKNLRLAKSGGSVQFCWDAATGACVQGYEILGSTSASSAVTWASAADPGSATCFTANPTGTYFLVVADGPGGQGRWGHYGN